MRYEKQQTIQFSVKMACFLCGVIILVITVSVLWLFSKQDSDLVLTLFEKFGKRKDSLRGKVVWITGIIKEYRLPVNGWYYLFYVNYFDVLYDRSINWNW